MANDFYIVTCEHGGNRIPLRYRPLFAEYEQLLHTHRGYDPGALRLAREMAAMLDAALFTSTVSRLLVDLNRSLSHPRLFSEISRAAAEPVRQEILRRYYLPYRTKVEALIAQAVERGQRVVQLSCHSFTPQLNGKVRNADIGLLYGTERPAEAAFCRQWQTALKARDPDLKIRLNYPYTGNDDGFTAALRPSLPAARYLGIEIEINQRHILGTPRHWRRTRELILNALREVAARNKRSIAATPGANRHAAPTHIT